MLCLVSDAQRIGARDSIVHMDAVVGPGILYGLSYGPRAVREERSGSTSSPASVLGERFFLLSAGLLPGVRSPDRLYWIGSSGYRPVGLQSEIGGAAAAQRFASGSYVVLLVGCPGGPHGGVQAPAAYAGAAGSRRRAALQCGGYRPG